MQDRDTFAFFASFAVKLLAVLTLREYRPLDFERLLEIDQACFVRGIAYTPTELHHFLNLKSAVRIVGEVEGYIKGFIIADKFRPRRSDQSMGQIITIDVLEEARRSGLGSRLMTAAEEELRKAGCGYVSLEVAVDNFSAIKFYKKHGYTGLKILPRYYLNSLDALLMGKKL